MMFDEFKENSPLNTQELKDSNEIAIFQVQREQIAATVHSSSTTHAIIESPPTELHRLPTSQQSENDSGNILFDFVLHFTRFQRKFQTQITV